MMGIHLAWLESREDIERGKTEENDLYVRDVKKVGLSSAHSSFSVVPRIPR